MTGPLLRFRRLLGSAAGAGPGEPVAHLLELGPLCILLDAGWTDAFELATLEPLLSEVPRLDLVLLSQPDVAHCGALPYLVAKAGLAAPVLATWPVAKLGELSLYDHHTAVHDSREFDAFSVEDVDAAFRLAVRAVKHHQRLALELKGLRLQLEAFPAGHMVGGAIWVLTVGGESVVYGPHSNHMKERLLNGGELSRVPLRPALMVLDAGRANAKAVTRAAREKELQDAIVSTCQRGGSVLLPVDSAGRMLEVLLVLDRMWGRDKDTFVWPLLLLSSVSQSSLRVAGGMLEWMSDELQREFNASNTNPLACKYVKRVFSPRDLADLGPGPKVVLATGQSLDVGLARALLLAWGGDARNRVVFTQQPRAGTLGALLLAPRAPGPLQMSVTSSRRLRLVGEELDAFNAAAAAQAAAEAAAEAAAGEAGVAEGLKAADPGALPMRESSGAISQLKRGAGGAVEQVLVDAAGGAFDAFGASALLDEGVLLDGFAPPAGAMFSMFPDEQEQLQQDWDAYGAVCDSSLLRQDEATLLDASGPAPEEDWEPEEDEGPTKVISEDVLLSLLAPAVLVDGFAGLSDGRSLRAIVGERAPRSLLLAGGSAADAADMAAACGRELPRQSTRIHTLGPGEEVCLPLAASFAVGLSKPLLAGLSRHSLLSGLYEVAWLDGLLAQPPRAGLGAGEACGGAEGGGADAAAAAAAGAEAAAAAAAAAAGAETGAQAAGGGGAAAAGRQPPGGATCAQLQLLPDVPPAPELTLVPPGAEPTPGAAAAGAGGSDASQGGEAMDVDGACEDGGAGASQAASQADAAACAAAPADAAAAAAAAAGGGGELGGIFIGDVKLSEVKQALAAAGMPSEFRGGGRLVVGGQLTVRRDGPEGQLVLEGPLSEQYFDVRDVVYSLYNVC